MGVCPSSIKCLIKELFFASLQISWEEHTLIVNGLVDRSLTFTMEEIVQMPAVDVTCTLTCAGNRRKEQNMVKKTIGFNWGPSGTGCSVWTGVRLCYLLQVCGVESSGKARHVCMRGPKGELPRGEDGSYGTSIALDRAMNPAYDVILAYKQNGALLTPDHGFPLRVIIPGYIGGRMIKWIQEITVSETESDNYYHFHDNRILPSHVDEEKANEEDWWHHPDFIFNDLNINSAIISPGHDEALPLEANQNVEFGGYAYSNGNKIIRCEISLDDGQSWKLAEISRQAKPNSYGKVWAWVWWKIAVPVAELLHSSEVICRSWDSSMNTQPNTFTWNVMGMGNNCVYRVKMHPCPMQDGRFAIKFEHPTVAGPSKGGWMDPPANPSKESMEIHANGNAKAVNQRASRTNGKRFTMQEVEKHDSEESAWFVHSGRVYDATPFLKEHPGGADSILLVAGTDATDEFNAIHSKKAKEMLEKYCIGELMDEKHPSHSGNENSNTAPVLEDLVSLNPKKRIPFKLVQKDVLSHNVRRFRFALPSPRHRFGLPVGKHVFLYAKIDGELVMRAYTPTSSDDDLGHFDLVVKIYRANEHPKFPQGGKMSQYLEAMEIGETIDVKGPVGHVVYLGTGHYTIEGTPCSASRINLFAGGTGITPAYQIIKQVLKNPNDKTQLRLLYANQTPDDILLKEELDALSAAHSNFDVHYTVDRVPEGLQWNHFVGFINVDMVKDCMFPSDDSTICLMCGPPPMLKFAVIPSLQSMNFESTRMIQF